MTGPSPPSGGPDAGARISGAMTSVPGENGAERFPRVDALFAGEPPPPMLEAGARIRRLRSVLMIAIPLNLLGIPCWTGVPGAVLTLWAYLTADNEMARIDAGQYSGEDAAVIMRLRTISTYTLYFCVVSFIGQAWLMSTSFYNLYFSWLVGLARTVWG